MPTNQTPWEAGGERRADRMARSHPPCHRRRRARRCREDDGSALAEFALVLPFIVLVVFAVIDMGRVYSMQHRVTSMAREGATFAQANPTLITNAGTICASGNNITDRAKNEDPTLAADPNIQVGVQSKSGSVYSANLSGCNVAPLSADGTYRVQVRYTNFKLLTPIARQFVNGGSLTVTGSAEVYAMGAS